MICFLAGWDEITMVNDSLMTKIKDVSLLYVSYSRFSFTRNCVLHCWESETLDMCIQQEVDKVN